MEQRNAALVDEEVCYALLDTEFQLADRLMRCEAKDPALNVALDRREGELRVSRQGKCWQEAQESSVISQSYLGSPLKKNEKKRICQNVAPPPTFTWGIHSQPYSFV